MRAENLSVAAAFDLSYPDLTPGQQRLFRRLGLNPGPDIDAHAAAALDDTSLDAARRGLEGLYDQHLLTEPAPGRYRLHDLLREHARALAAADDPPTRDAAPAGCWTTTCTPRWPPASTSPPDDLAIASLPPGRPPACAPRAVHARAGSRLAGSRARQPARGRRLRRRHAGGSQHAIAIPAAMAIPARPGPLGPGPRPAPDRPGRGAPGR